MKIAIINGPNLNLLGKREESIYGSQTFEEYLVTLKAQFPDHEISYFQSNIEGELVTAIQEVGSNSDGAILNAGAYTHTSIAMADAISGIQKPVVEVHISNVFAREDFRHVSYITPVCKGSIAGFGLDSYRLALLSLIS
ncbi:MAG: type II 3-dehydroquinate dehydratase [Flavobacteriales bacterium]|nr:type II 3-dehydroquinate dehydratase [Flavobacteriales bacterium]